MVAVAVARVADRAVVVVVVGAGSVVVLMV